MANPIRMDKESLQALQGNNLSCPRDYSFLDKIDDAFVETNQLLNQAEDITGFGYISQKSRMHDIFMAYWELNTCIDTLLQEITEADNQLHKMVNDTANELERICLEDIEIPDTIHYYNSYEELPTLTINNFIQDGFVETNASVQGFVDLFDGVIIYGEDEMTLEEYVQYLETQSVCTISYYSGEKANLNLLVTDLSMGVKDLFDGIAGYDIITGEHLSQQERTFKLWWGIGMMSFNLLMPAISGLRAQQAIGQKIYKWLDDIFLMEGVNSRILGGISQELAEQTARSGIQTLSNKGLNTISRQITEEGVEDAIQITAREGVETIGEHVVQEGMEDTIRITTREGVETIGEHVVQESMENSIQITTREGIEDTIQTATRDRIEAFGQRITSEGISIGSHPWESIYSGVKENAAILEKQVIQQEIYILNRYDSTYGIRATEQQLTREGVETTLETVSREGIEEMQEQAMREAAEAMESGRVSSKTSYRKSSDIFLKPDTTRINLAKGRTRFTPFRESGNSVSAGMQHVIEGHFNRPLSNSRSIFSISVDDLKGILQRKSVITSPISDLGNGQYKRVVDVGENIGNTALKHGGKPTSWIEIITDVKGNIITTYPVPKP